MLSEAPCLSATLAAIQTGSIAANFHEGSRSEYLAQFAFSAFGTAIPVPHQEDSGLDMYCTLLEQEGRRAWPRAYYSVQVKSTMAPWVFSAALNVSQAQLVSGPPRKAVHARWLAGEAGTPVRRRL